MGGQQLRTPGRNLVKALLRNYQGFIQLPTPGSTNRLFNDCSGSGCGGPGGDFGSPGGDFLVAS